MTNQTRKRIWPVALMSLAVFGVLAAVVALSAMTPQTTQADGCDQTNPVAQAECVRDHVAAGLDHEDSDHDHNMAPTAVGSIAAVTVTVGMMTDAKDVSGYFNDADGDALTYTAMSNNTAVAEAGFNPPFGGSSMLVITGVSAGDAIITVTATDAAGASDTQSIMVTVEAPVEKPSAPTHVRSYVLDNAIIVRWDKPEDIGPEGAEITHYVITRTAYTSDVNSPINASGGKTIKVLSTVREYRDQGLGYNTTYSHTVTAYNKYTVSGVVMNGVGPASAPVTTVTGGSGGYLLPEEAPPGAPTSASATAACADSILFMWGAPTDNGKVAPDVVGCPVCANQTPPHVGGDNAGIDVKPGTAIIVGYMVERKVNNGSWSTLEARTTDTEYMDSQSLAYDNTYTYRVTAVNNAGLYGESTTAMVTLTQPAAPQRPSSLVVNLEQDNSIFELQWDPPGDTGTPRLWRTEDDFIKATGYDHRSRDLSYLVERQIGNGPWTSIIEPNEAPENYVVGTHVHLVTLPDGTMQYALRHEYSREGLNTIRTQEHRDRATRGTADQDVKYRVSALVKSCNHSPWNQADEVELPAAIAPGMPTSLTARAMGTSQIDLSWGEPSEDGGSAITGYQVEYSRDGAAWFAPMNVGDVTSYSHTGLEIWPETPADRR